MARIKHHDMVLSFDVDEAYLHASDTLTFESTDPALTFHLGKDFNVRSISQEGHQFVYERVDSTKSTRVYTVSGVNPGKSLIIEYDGRVQPDEGYGVSVILESSIELSGFGFYFPTIERQCQLERFTYTLKTDLPREWTVLVPDDRPLETIADGERHFSHTDSPLQDILLCASRTYNVDTYKGMHLVLPEMDAKYPNAMRSDHRRAVDVLFHVFGEPKGEKGNVGIVSDRGSKAMDWGYERAHFWVVGHLFLKHVVENDWRLMGLEKSLSMHEMIHTYFGVGVGMTNPMAEAITQYLEVIMTARAFKDERLVARYFQWYDSRLSDNETLHTHAINDLSILDNHYDHWYLKGALAFRDLEMHVGRAALLRSLRKLYEYAHGRTLDNPTLIQILGGHLEKDLTLFYEHWFNNRGLSPYYAKTIAHLHTMK